MVNDALSLTVQALSGLLPSEPDFEQLAAGQRRPVARAVDGRFGVVLFFDRPKPTATRATWMLVEHDLGQWSRVHEGREQWTESLDSRPREHAGRRVSWNSHNFLELGATTATVIVGSAASPVMAVGIAEREPRAVAPRSGAFVLLADGLPESERLVLSLYGADGLLGTEESTVQVSGPEERRSPGEEPFSNVHVLEPEE